MAVSGAPCPSAYCKPYETRLSAGRIHKMLQYARVRWVAPDGSCFLAARPQLPAKAGGAFFGRACGSGLADFVILLTLASWRAKLLRVAETAKPTQVFFSWAARLLPSSPNEDADPK